MSCVRPYRPQHHHFIVCHMLVVSMAVPECLATRVGCRLAGILADVDLPHVRWLKGLFCVYFTHSFMREKGSTPCTRAMRHTEVMQPNSTEQGPATQQRRHTTLLAAHPTAWRIMSADGCHTSGSRREASVDVPKLNACSEQVDTQTMRHREYRPPYSGCHLH